MLERLLLPHTLDRIDDAPGEKPGVEPVPGDHVVGTPAHRLACKLHSVRVRDHDERGIGNRRPQLVEVVEPSQTAAAQGQDDARRASRPDPGERVVEDVHLHHLEALVRGALGEHLGDRRRAARASLDHEELTRRRGAGFARHHLPCPLARLRRSGAGPSPRDTTTRPA